MTSALASATLLATTLVSLSALASATLTATLLASLLALASARLSATTVDDVRGLEREEVSQVDGPSSADRRKLWLFCVAQREELETAVAHSA